MNVHQLPIMICDSHLENDFVIEVHACRPLVNEKFYPFCEDSSSTYVICTLTRREEDFLLNCESLKERDEFLFDKYEVLI